MRAVLLANLPISVAIFDTSFGRTTEAAGVSGSVAIGLGTTLAHRRNTNAHGQLSRKRSIISVRISRQRKLSQCSPSCIVGLRHSPSSGQRLTMS